MAGDCDDSACVGLGSLFLGRSKLAFDARIRLSGAETGHGRVAGEVGYNGLGGISFIAIEGR